MNNTRRLHWLRTALGICLLIGIAGAAVAQAPAPDTAASPLTGMMSADSTAVLTTDPADTVVAGSPALLGDSRRSSAEWNEFFHSRAGLLQPMHAYHIAFDYKILARGDTTEFYTMLRRKGTSSADRDEKFWPGTVGETGHVAFDAVIRHTDDYYLLIGIRNKGALSIGNLVIEDDPAQKPIDVGFPAPKRLWTSPGGTAYYVDSTHGADTASGLSAGQAWRSLARVNAGTFAPGDSILLAAGSAWNGFLFPGGGGSAGKPVLIGVYGQGAAPKIDAQGKWLAAVYLQNSEYFTVQGLDVANRGAVPQPGLAGVRVSGYNFGTLHDIALRDLDVHDVTGSNVKNDGGGNGITCTVGGDQTPTRFDGLTIENCHLTRTDRNGITMSGTWGRSAWFPSLHVVIRGNQLDDIGGDGIVPIACDGALVEHNVLRGGRMRADDYAAGIWPWSCDNTVVQYNDVSGMRGTNDGEGYDSDWNCRNSLFQYNYSHDNDGGFMLICDDGSVPPATSAGNTGTVIRYNISVDDGALHTFNISGPCTHTSIYNNTIYIGKGRTVHIVADGDWGGSYPDDTRFINNVFYVGGQADFAAAGMTNLLFDHNAFWGAVTMPPGSSHALTGQPRLSAPGGSSPGSYSPLAGSPLIGAGAAVPASGAHDFLGHALPAGKPPAVGAIQSQE